MPHDAKPTSAEVDEVTRKILTSETFAKSERGRDLLSYLVAKLAAGEERGIKGFTIAMDVFGRDETFDPNTDALVRVHMGRLRTLLADYYAGEGAQDELRLSIPKGSYVPGFERVVAQGGDRGSVREGVGGSGLVTVSTVFRTLTRQQNLMIALLVLILAGVSIVVYDQFSTSEEPSSPTTLPQIADNPTKENTTVAADGLPRLRLIVDGQTRDFNDPFIRRLRAELSRFDTISLIESKPAKGVPVPASGHDHYVLEVRSALDADVEGYSHSLEIRHPFSGRLIWLRSVDAGARNPNAIFHETDRLMPLMIEVASPIAAFDGVIVSDFMNQTNSNELFRCLRLVQDLGIDLNPYIAEKVTECLGNRFDKTNLEPLAAGIFAVARVQQTEAVVSSSPATEGPFDELLEDATQTLRSSLSHYPRNAGLNDALAVVSVRGGEMSHEGALELSSQAVARLPADWRLWANRGRLTVQGGDFKNGDALLEALQRLAGRLPAHWAYTRFLAALGQNNPDDMFRWAGHLAGVSDPHYYIARIIAANRAGEIESQNRLMARLQRTYPEVYANPPLYIRAQGHGPALQRILLEMAQQAGIFRFG